MAFGVGVAEGGEEVAVLGEVGGVVGDVVIDPVAPVEVVEVVVRGAVVAEGAGAGAGGEGGGEDEAVGGEGGVGAEDGGEHVAPGFFFPGGPAVAAEEGRGAVVEINDEGGLADAFTGGGAGPEGDVCEGDGGVEEGGAAQVCEGRPQDAPEGWRWCFHGAQWLIMDDKCGALALTGARCVRGSGSSVLTPGFEPCLRLHPLRDWLWGARF